MTANHAAYVFEPQLLAGGSAGFATWCALYALGGITFPLMAFLLVEGYRHTSNFRRYLTRLLAFALIAQAPWFLVLSQNLNVLFTLAIGLVLLRLYDLRAQLPLAWLVGLALLAFSWLCDWGVIGPLMIFLFYKLENDYAATNAPASARRRSVFITVGMAVLAEGISALGELLAGSPAALAPLLYATLGHSVATLMLYAYNNRRGRPLKWFFYAYYPAHIAVLGILNYLL